MVFSSWLAALGRETALVVIPASRRRAAHPSANHSAESVLLFSAQIACNAVPCRQCRRSSRHCPATSTALSTLVPTREYADPSEGRRTIPDSSRRAERRSRGFRPLRRDRRLPHPETRNGREVVSREFPPIPSSLTSFRSAGSLSGRACCTLVRVPPIRGHCTACT